MTSHLGLERLHKIACKNYKIDRLYPQGIANTSLDIRNVQELTWCNETLEAYRITGCSGYPNIERTAMTAINIQTGSVNPTIGWEPVDSITDRKQ